jgi:hypothetical protein
VGARVLAGRQPFAATGDARDGDTGRGRKKRLARDPGRQFLITLALRFGRTPDELERALTARELIELQAFDQGSPLSEWRGDFNAASIVSAIYRAAGAKGVKVSDCMPPWQLSETGKSRQQPASGIAAFKSFLLAKLGKS